MKIKAIGFDVGGTLVNYNKPLNWSAFYESAITFMCKKHNILLTTKRLNEAKKILEKYNTRINPREIEVSSQIIFEEIFQEWKENRKKVESAKKSFYDFFQREAFLYDDVKPLLKYCKSQKILCSTYTDVAYGMDDEISLKDIAEISDYIELKLTSVNVGYRKPNKKGFQIMLEKFKCLPEQMIYVGDEEKDMQGAKAVKMKTILINRNKEKKEFKQDYEISNLLEIIDIMESL